MPLIQADLAAIRREYQSLYTQQDPSGKLIWGLITYAILDEILAGEETVDGSEKIA